MTDFTSDGRAERRTYPVSHDDIHRLMRQSTVWYKTIDYSTFAALIAGVISLWAWAGWAFPFEMRVDAEQVRERLATVEERLGSMDRTGLLSLQLQLQTRIDQIERDLAETAMPDGVRSTLLQTRRGLQQQLSEVTLQLRQTPQ